MSSRGWRAAGKVCAITGAASGIGRALCGALARNGARSIIALDVDADGVQATARALASNACHVQAMICDAADDASLRKILQDVGPLDLFAANAGIATEGSLGDGSPTSLSLDEWQRTWQVNVMQIATAADVVIPGMVERGGGAFMVTASAAGLLTQLGSAPYTTTKHAAVGLAEWLAITYGDAGVHVTCLCPQGVRTPMLTNGLLEDDGTIGRKLARAVAVDGLLEADDVASEALEALAAGTFLCAPGDASAHAAKKAKDRERWMAGMRRLQAKLLAD